MENKQIIKQSNHPFSTLWREETGKLGEYARTYGVCKDLHLLFSDQLADYSEQSVWFFLETLWTESFCKGVERSLLGSVTARLCQPSLWKFELDESRAVLRLWFGGFDAL